MNAGSPAATTPDDMLQSRKWMSRFTADPASLPISFTLDETAITGIPADWRPVATWRRIDANIAETVFEGTEPGSGLTLRVECTAYRDYPVVEWVAWFTNTGDESTPPVRDILAMDGMFAGPSPVIHHCNGDFCSDDGYTPVETQLAVGGCAG